MNAIADCNQSACFYGTAETHKLENVKDITVVNLKFSPIIDQAGTFTYNAAKVILGYLGTLFEINIPSKTCKYSQMCYLQFHLCKG